MSPLNELAKITDLHIWSNSEKYPLFGRRTIIPRYHIPFEQNLLSSQVVFYAVWLQVSNAMLH